MHLEIQGLTAEDAPTLVLASGLGGVAGFWQPQLAALTPHYRVVTYDQRGTGRSADTLPDGYSMTMMAAELAETLQQHGIQHYDIIGHALGGLIGLQLALDFPQRVGRVVVINGWLSLDAHTQRCFQVRQDLLMNVGVEAFVRAQPLFLYPAEWLARNQERINAEDAHHVAHFQGMENLLRRLHALKSADFRPHVARLSQPVLAICSQDDLLVPWSCSPQLAQALPNGSLIEMAWGGHAMSVTDADNFNALLLRWLADTAAPAQRAAS
ncbi:pyrimidine utilization protein D [Pantoea sp. B9002]|uniref:pyrimidine utilization protein D n=1 Tax=Pantoea sp. B9002 TaxID=2726979 RepID=UPI00159FDB3B|nr:pyrimidine utilization protein D [Pantoea sp. B9002]NWA60453.1 pyrimidine utilization protein D [Pantoea sp. B9002]